jgi:ATP-dependent Clp protease ATP-binding subunit ClpC
MKDPNRPIFSGILIGNSGVGKTELAKQLAKYLFDSEDSLIRLDMSEYMEKISLTEFKVHLPGILDMKTLMY